MKLRSLSDDKSASMSVSILAPGTTSTLTGGEKLFVSEGIERC